MILGKDISLVEKDLLNSFKNFEFNIKITPF
jgi:hypothetical protein